MDAAPGKGPASIAPPVTHVPAPGPGRRSDPRPRIGCVSFLNAKPLIDGFDPAAADVRFAVPSELLSALEADAVDIALCPIIDYFRSAVPLQIVPVGGIGCDGPTLTVRLFSRVEPARIRTVAVDGDSHTSVALLQIILDQMHGVRPRVVGLDEADAGEAIMLIGDKVVTDPPDDPRMSQQFDLGELWHRMTGLPFVFAVWMCRRDFDAGPVAGRLDALRRTNAGRIDELVARHAPAHGWPADLARQYLGRLLHYEVSDRDLEAIERFAQTAARLRIIESADTPRIWRPAVAAGR